MGLQLPFDIAKAYFQAASATALRTLADRAGDRCTLEEFSASTVGPHVALAAAITAGFRYIIIDRAYTWTAGYTMVAPDVTLEFRSLQTKAFSGDVFLSWGGARPFILFPRWVANGALYTGNIFSFTNGTRGAIFYPWCNDLPDVTGYFLEETAEGSLAGMDVFGGFLNTATSGISKAHFKLYGDANNGPAGGVGSAGFFGPYFRVDMGASREARIIGAHSEWPVTYPTTSGNGGTHSAHLIGNRFTSQRGDNSMEVEGDAHALTGNITAAAVSFNASNLSMDGNVFPSTCILNGSNMSVGPTNFKTGFTVGTSFSGSIAQGQGQTTIATNTNATLVAGTDGPFVLHTGTLTADRTITLSNGWAGAFFEINRIGSGAFNLLISDGVTTLRYMASGNRAVFRHNGTAWVDATFVPASFPVAQLPASSLLPVGTVVVLSDVGEGGSRWVATATEWKPVSPVTIYHSTTPINITQSAETAPHLSVLLKGILMGLTNQVEGEGLFSFTISANAKTIKVRHHSAAGVSGSAYVNMAPSASAATMLVRFKFRQDGTASSQVAAAAIYLDTPSSTGSSAAVLTGAVNCASDSYVNWIGSVAGGETLVQRMAQIRISA